MARRLKRAKVCSLSCFHMCAMEILVWSSCHVILFLTYFCLSAAETKTQLNLNHFFPDMMTYHLSAYCQLLYLTEYGDLSRVRHCK